jgi:magnesium chelatase family protein
LDGGFAMFARVTTVAFEGIEARAVDVQIQIGPGLPAFTIVGLPDKAVAESRERVRGALNAIGLALPPKRITVNLAPADLPKEGSHYDLPIALGLMAATGGMTPSKASACSANCRSTARSPRWPAPCPRRSAPARSARG